MKKRTHGRNRKPQTLSQVRLATVSGGGGAGNDTLLGGRGNDIVLGTTDGGSDDVLFGGLGQDVIQGRS